MAREKVENMKKSIIPIILSTVLLSSLFTTNTFAKEKVSEVVYVHTFCNVAIYYSKDGGYIVDEDGERFDIDFNITNESVIFVTYDNKNTVTRFDDEPIKYEILTPVENE